MWWNWTSFFYLLVVYISSCSNTARILACHEHQQPNKLVGLKLKMKCYYQQPEQSLRSLTTWYVSTESMANSCAPMIQKVVRLVWRGYLVGFDSQILISIAHSPYYYQSMEISPRKEWLLLPAFLEFSVPWALWWLQSGHLGLEQQYHVPQSQGTREV